MRLYRLERYTTLDGSTGFIWFDNKKEAMADAGEEDRIEQFVVPCNKQGIIDFLNLHCSYPDNG